MAVLWIEGFEGFGATNGTAVVGLQAKWGNSLPDSNFTVQAGRLGGKSCRLGNGAVSMQTPNLGTPSTIIIGFGFYQDAFASAQDILYLMDGATLQGTLAIQTDGKFKYYKGSSLSVALGTTSSGVSASTWTYVELKVKIHASTGTVDVLFDGVSRLALTGQNTDQATSGLMRAVRFLGSTGGGDHTQLDDLYICDTTGSVNTGLLGPQKIVMVKPANDGGTNQFTTNSGSTHYDRVNQNPPDGDTTYLEDATTGHQELFGYDAVTGLASVTALQMNTVARLTDANQFSVKSSILSNGTGSDDTAQTVSGIDFQSNGRVVETDPHTSAAWTVAGVNAAKFGFKVG